MARQRKPRTTQRSAVHRALTAERDPQSLAAFVLRYLEWMKVHNYSPHTVESYLWDLDQFRQTIRGTLPAVTRRDVEAFIDQQRAQRCSPRTINRRLAALRHFYEFWADQHGQPAENPVRPTHFLRQPRSLPRPLKAEELERFFRVVTDLRDRTIFTLMLRAGLRVSEVAKLEVEDVDLRAGTVFVCQGKGRRDRQVYLSADAHDLLRACLAQRPAMKTSRFFWNRKRKSLGLSVKAIQKAMDRYCEQAGIQGSCHRLRHTFATQLLENGAQLLTVRDCLGHSSVLSSMGYAKLSDERVRTEYYRAMERVLSELQRPRATEARTGYNEVGRKTKL